MSEFDTTLFVNIDDEDFTGYYNASKEPNGWTIKAGESRTLIAPMAETFAKHLVDKLLTKKGVKDTMRDTDLRRSLFAQVLPEIEKLNPKVKKLSPDEEAQALKKQLADQARAIGELSASVKSIQDDKDKEIERLKNELEQAKKGDHRVDNLAKARAARKAKLEAANNAQ